MDELAEPCDFLGFIHFSQILMKGFSQENPHSYFEECFPTSQNSWPVRSGLIDLYICYQLFPINLILGFFPPVVCLYYPSRMHGNDRFTGVGEWDP